MIYINIYELKCKIFKSHINFYKRRGFNIKVKFEMNERVVTIVNFARRSIMGSTCHRLRRFTMGGRVTTVPYHVTTVSHHSIPPHFRPQVTPIFLKMNHMILKNALPLMLIEELSDSSSYLMRSLFAL